MSMDPIDGVASPSSNYEKYKDMFENKDKDLITMDNFYELLVAEMQNQDPLEPTSNTEFISQMASFAAMQSQQDAFDVQKQQYANTLVGKTVTVSSGDNAVTGVVTSVTHGDDEKLMINGKTYSLSSLSQVHSSEETTSRSIGDYGAFAAGLLGKTVTVGSIGVSGDSYYDQGVVQSLEVEDGSVRIVVNGFAYDVSDVMRVTETPVQTEEPAQPLTNVVTAAENNTAAANAAGESAAVKQTEAIAQETEEPDIQDIEETDEVTDQQLRELFE